jgi:hypothetical protein
VAHALLRIDISVDVRSDAETSLGAAD